MPPRSKKAKRNNRRKSKRTSLTNKKYYAGDYQEYTINDKPVKCVYPDGSDKSWAYMLGFRKNCSKVPGFQEPIMGNPSPEDVTTSVPVAAETTEEADNAAAAVSDAVSLEPNMEKEASEASETPVVAPAPIAYYPPRNGGKLSRKKSKKRISGGGSRKRKSKRSKKSKK